MTFSAPPRAALTAAPLVPPLLAELEQYWDAHTALCHALLDALVAAEVWPFPPRPRERRV